MADFTRSLRSGVSRTGCTQVLKELNEMAAQTKDSITSLLTEVYMAMHRGFSAADKNEKK